MFHMYVQWFLQIQNLLVKTNSFPQEVRIAYLLK